MLLPPHTLSTNAIEVFLNKTSNDLFRRRFVSFPILLFYSAATAAKLSKEKKLEGEQNVEREKETVERGETRPIWPGKVHKMKRTVWQV